MGIMLIVMVAVLALVPGHMESFGHHGNRQEPVVRPPDQADAAPGASQAPGRYEEGRHSH